MAILRTIGQYALGVAFFALIIAWAGACAVGKAWVRDNSPDWFYNVASPFLRGEDGFIQIGYDEYECSNLADDVENAAENGNSDALVILEDIRGNCKRDYRRLRDDVRGAMEEEGIDPSDIDCRMGGDAILEALRARDPSSVIFVAVAFQDSCPAEYASFIQGVED